MAREKVRCPLCGHVVNPEAIERFYPIETFIVHGLGKGRGFKFERIVNNRLISKIKLKLLGLYSVLFGIKFDVEPFPKPYISVKSFSEPYELRGWEVVGEA